MLACHAGDPSSSLGQCKLFLFSFLFFSFFLIPLKQNIKQQKPFLLNATTSPIPTHKESLEVIRFSLTETDCSRCPEEALSTRKRVIDIARSINSTVLPINYAESFYNSLFRYPEDRSVAWTAFVKGKKEGDKDEPSGAIILKPDKGAGVVSILTFAVLSGHRSKGIGKALIEKAYEECKKRIEEEEKTEGDSITKEKSIWREMEVHVQKDNEGAIRFYKGQGFRQRKGHKEEINYYRRASFGSTTAVVLYKKILLDTESPEPAKKKRKNSVNTK